MPFHPILLFLDVSGGELLVIIIVVFLVFGPDKMPEIARKIGKAMNQMKKASNDISREFRNQTSDLTNEIASVQNKVKEEVNKVNREINSTKGSIMKNMDIDGSKSSPGQDDVPVQSTNTITEPETPEPEPVPEVYRESENAG